MPGRTSTWKGLETGRVLGFSPKIFFSVDVQKGQALSLFDAFKCSAPAPDGLEEGGSHAMLRSQAGVGGNSALILCLQPWESIPSLLSSWPQLNT